MKSLTTTLIFLFITQLNFGQVKIYSLDFDSPSSYTTIRTDGSVYNEQRNGSNIFGLVDYTDLSSTSKEYDCNISKFFAVAGTASLTPAVDESNTNYLGIQINDIDLSGYTDIVFKVYLAEDDNTKEDYDHGGSSQPEKNDFVRFNYDVNNSGTYTPLLWIAGSGDNTDPSHSFNDLEPSLDEDFNTVGDGKTFITNEFQQFSVPINGVPANSLLDIEVIFKLNSTQEDIAIDNIEIWGESTVVPDASYVYWDGTGWHGNSGNPPNNNFRARIQANYDTATHGSFTANRLLVEKASTLTISDGTYVEIENDVYVNDNSSIIIEPYGSLVQKNETTGTITKESAAIMQAKKTTSLMAAHYEYTFWSAPVTGSQTMGEFNPDHNRLFVYNGANFIDNCKETNNQGNCIKDSPDDIDDDGNDWVQIPGSFNYVAGDGFISSMYKSAFDAAAGSAPKQFTYTFDGTFNTGDITTPIYRNDTELNDKNFNLVGNPYPSAIDAIQFISGNTNPPYSGIDGAIYIWSQYTPPAANVNGNAVYNFSDDYITINLSGATNNGPGADPVEKNGYIAIPSGQAFFVTMSNNACSIPAAGSNIFTTNVIFDNSMRIADADANSEFFKNTTVKNTTTDNKIWINLTNDYGGFNQILVAYLNGATNGDDGLLYDVNKYPKDQSSLYSIIAGIDKKFTIQAKAKNSLTASEIIQLGFQSGEDVSLNYNIMLDHTQGDFFANNPIYLKDNITGVHHDLSAGDYTFTSAKGEFNDRFEIVFQNNALSVDEFVSPDALQMINLEEDNFLFKLNSKSNLNIETVEIYDLLGRVLYSLDADSASETYHLPNLGNIFIAKVKLSNNTVVTKKGVVK